MPAPSLAQLALKGTIFSFKDLIDSKSATFVCGGSIPIVPYGTPTLISHEKTHRTSPPVRIYWHNEENATSGAVSFPVRQDAIGFSQFLNTCSATLSAPDDNGPFLAGTLNAKYFASTFHPADYGILDAVEQALLPSISTHYQNLLGFQRVAADLTRLNVINSTCSKENFIEMVDTPWSQNQLGSLIVCLPSGFKGREMLFQHGNRVVGFDWARHGDSRIQWAAFYSDSVHQLQGLTKGCRITLIYRLYVVEPIGSAIVHDDPIIEAKSLPLYSYVNDLLRHPALFKRGEL